MRTALIVGAVVSVFVLWLASTSPYNALTSHLQQLGNLLMGSRLDIQRRFSLKPYEIAPLLLSFMVAALANACGVGGGAFFVPMFNILLGFSLKGSTALSQSVVTGGACAGFIYSSFKRHPDDREQSLVDFDLALVLTPMLLLGITAGVLINAVMPNWLITVLLVIVLAWLTYKTVLKGIQLHKSEQEAQNGFPIMGSNAHADEPPEQRSASSKSATAHSPAPVTSDSDATCVIHITSPEPATSEAVNTVNLMDQQQHLHNHDGHQPEGDAYSSQIPQQDGGMEQPASDQSENTQPLHLCMCIPWQVVQFAELTLLWSAFLALQYGKVTYSQCSWQFAVLFLAQGIFSLCATAAFMYQSRVLRSSRQTQLQQPLLEDRKQITSHHDWTTLVLVKCVGTTVVGGTIAGMLGFGGGMILNPLMLEMGIHPLVSSATSSVMVLFSASTATFAFAVNDRLNYQYAAVYGGVCAVASLFGVAVISTSVRRSGKGSLVVFILSMIIGTGALLQAVFGGIAVIQDVKNGRHLSFSSWC